MPKQESDTHDMQQATVVVSPYVLKEATPRPPGVQARGHTLGACAGGLHAWGNPGVGWHCSGALSGTLDR